MGWWAHLVDDRGHDEGEWNFTHNTSCMIYAVLADAGIELPPSTRPCSAPKGRDESGDWLRDSSGDVIWEHHPNGHGTIPWWEHLNGMSGPDGAAFLHTIIVGLEADPARFEAMNPSNGWGSYVSLLDVLRGMRDAVSEWPTVWVASG